MWTTSRGFRGALLAILCSVLTPGAIYTAEQRPLWLAVSRAGLVKAIEPLAAKRRADGFEVRISTKSIEEAIAESPRRPAFLLLVGDDEPGQSHSPWYLPAKRVELYRWRLAQRREYASDAAWGDLHGRGVPEIAVGRIPARSRASRIEDSQDSGLRGAAAKGRRFAGPSVVWLAGIWCSDRCHGLRARR